jgi:hypothetical protein
MQKEASKKPKFDMDKAKELLNDSKEEKKESKVQEKVITAIEVESLIKQLQQQYQKLNQEFTDRQTMMLKTQGAIEVATAQLQGLKDDSKPTD